MQKKICLGHWLIEYNPNRYFAIYQSMAEYIVLYSYTWLHQDNYNTTSNILIKIMIRNLGIIMIIIIIIIITKRNTTGTMG